MRDRDFSKGKAILMPDGSICRTRASSAKESFVHLKNSLTPRILRMEVTGSNAFIHHFCVALVDDGVIVAVPPMYPQRLGTGAEQRPFHRPAVFTE